MRDPGKIGGEEPSIQPGGPEGVSGGPTGDAIEGALHQPIKTLDDLKRALIDNLGEEKGKKLYNTFMKGFAMQMLNQVQHSAQQAKKAAKQMRSGK